MAWEEPVVSTARWPTAALEENYAVAPGQHSLVFCWSLDEGTLLLVFGLTTTGELRQHTH